MKCRYPVQALILKSIGKGLAIGIHSEKPGAPGTQAGAGHGEERSGLHGAAAPGDDVSGRPGSPQEPKAERENGQPGDAAAGWKGRSRPTAHWDLRQLPLTRRQRGSCP